MSNIREFDLSLKEKFGLTTSDLRPTSKSWDTVWSEFKASLTSSVKAVLNGVTEHLNFVSTNPRHGHYMVRTIWQPDEKVHKPMFVIGYGKANYWFENGITTPRKGLDLIADRKTIKWLATDEGLASLKPFVLAKFEAEREKGRKAFAQRLANADIGYLPFCGELNGHDSGATFDEVFGNEDNAKSS